MSRHPEDFKSALHKAALEYIAEGISVFPCLPGTKKPATEHGFKDASLDPEQINRWWSEVPDRNVAMCPHDWGWAVIDEEHDAKPGWSNGQDLPETRTHRTPRGGRHLIYSGSLPSTTAKLAPRVDTRGKGGFVVLPPSLVRDEKTGKVRAYNVIDDREPADLPAWIPAALATVAPKAKAPAGVVLDEPGNVARAIRHLKSLPAVYEDHGSDDAAFKACAVLKELGLSPAKAVETMMEYFKCTPKTEEWITVKVRNAFRHSQNELGAYAAKGLEESFGAIVAKFADVGEITNVVPGSEDDLATAFTQSCGDRLRFVAEWNRWLAFDGQRWVEVPEPFIWNLVRPLLRASAGLLADGPATRRKMTSKATIASVASLARGDVLARADQFDADPWLLNTPGGIVDLRTGKLQTPDRSAYCIKMTAVAPSQATAPRWAKFLDDITAGNAELQGYLQRFVGYSLTGLTIEHALQFLYGTGNNGKGVYLGTVNGIMGTYAMAAPADMFTETKGDRHPTDMAMLQGARFVSAQETDEGRHWAEAKVKMLTGGDTIRARFMRGDFFEFKPTHKLTIAGNHKPRLRNVDEAFRRRLHFVPFTVTIPEKDRDPSLPEKLRDEWPAILQWAIDGCVEWQMFGLDPPAIVRDMTKEYFTAQDPVAEWIEAKCARQPIGWTSHKDLYASWQGYLTRNNEHEPLGPRLFSQRLESHGFTPRKGGANRDERGFAGIVLK